MATVTFDSSRVRANMLRLAKALPRRAAIALNEVAEETMTDSKEHTPVQYGVLKASGKVSQYATDRRLTAKLAYGTEYAVYVHERLELKHRVGEAKFLEHAVMRTAATLAGRIVSKIGSLGGY